LNETRLDLHVPLRDEDTIGWVIERAREDHPVDPEEGARALLAIGACLLLVSGVGFLLIGFWRLGVL